MGGTLFRHGKVAGYIVCGSRGALSACRDYDNTGETILLYGNPITLFRTRRQAQRAKDTTIRLNVFPHKELYIMRVATVA